MNIPGVVIRGGGEMASGVAHRLFVCGFRPIVLELSSPRLIRQTVCFGEAVYSGTWTVEGVTARRAESAFLPHEDFIPVIVDPRGETIPLTKPSILIDGRMQKTDVDLKKDDAPLVIGLGPPIEAGRDAHKVVETQRGHLMGKVYSIGKALSYTGLPGEIDGKSAARVLRSPCRGIFHSHMHLGEVVEKGAIIARVEGFDLKARFRGRVRGLIREGLIVEEGEKVGDIDPREDVDIHSISDKARAIGGGVLEAIFSHFPWSIKLPKEN
jgi:xanthine dehydrogenase accessory factor